MTDKSTKELYQDAGYITPNLTRRSLIKALALTFVLIPFALVVVWLAFLKLFGAAISPATVEMISGQVTQIAICIAVPLVIGMLAEIGGLVLTKKGVRDE